MEAVEKRRILVIEDERHIAEGIKLNLTIQGYEVFIAPDGIVGLETWRTWHPDLIILDIMLPMIDGYSVLQTIRREDEKLPVLILSAKGSAKDKVRGLQCGVDDYLAKPFDLDEFLLRVKRLLERHLWYAQAKDVAKASHSSGPCELYDGDHYQFGDNLVDFVTGKADCIAGSILLTEQEVKLLKVFIANLGKPVSREKLLEVGWGYSTGTTTRTVDNFMVRFRKYFENNPKKPLFFKSRRSIGYIFDHGEKV